MDNIKKYTVEILLISIIILTVFIRTMKQKRFKFSAVIGALSSAVIGACVGISVYIGTTYIISSTPLSFLIGYLTGSLGERLLDVLDLKFADIVDRTIDKFLKKDK